jgi:hypothetical protein
VSDLSTYTERLAQETHRLIPIMNARITASNGGPQPLIDRFKPTFTELRSIAVEQADSITKTTARQLMSIVDITLGSAERLAQLTGWPAGAAKNQFSDIDELLVLLAKRGDLPRPRGDHMTYWFTSHSNMLQLTFTGTNGELAFGDAVRALDGGQRENALETLKPIIDGSVPIVSWEGVERLKTATDVEIDIRNAIAGLRRRDTDGVAELTIETFTVNMRTGLTPYPVLGVMETGPNAANVCGQVLYDLALGIYDPAYLTTTVPERAARMDTADRARVQAMIDAPKDIFTLALAELPVTRKQILSYSAQMTAEHLQLSSKHVISMLEAFLGLWKAGSKIWGSHQSAIVHYLERAEREVEAATLEKAGVKTNSGVGGKSHSETEALMRMRSRDGTLLAIDAALKAIVQVA